MEKENLDFKSALEWFAHNCGVDVRLAGGNRCPTLQPKSKTSTVAGQVIPQNETGFTADTELYAWLVNHCPVVSSPKGNEYLASHGISQESGKRFNIRELRDPKFVFGRLVEQWGAQRVYRSGIAWGKDANPERLIWGSPALLFPFYTNGSVIYLQCRMFEGNRKYLNPRGIAKPLFNSDRLSNLPAGSLIHICEGVPDTVAMETHRLLVVGADCLCRA